MDFEWILITFAVKMAFTNPFFIFAEEANKVKENINTGKGLVF